MITSKEFYFELKLGIELEEIASRIFSSFYFNNSNPEVIHGAITKPLPDQSYEAETTGVFNSDPPQNYQLFRRYIEYRSAGFTTYPELNFSFKDCHFMLTSLNGAYKIQYKGPNFYVPFLTEVMTALEEYLKDKFISNFQENFSVRESVSEAITIRQDIANNYFNRIRKDMKTFSDAFEFSEITSNQDPERWEEFKKTIRYRSNGVSVVLNYMVDIQKEINRNYTFLNLEIAQNLSKEIPGNFIIYFTHKNRHDIGQIDFTVNQCYIQTKDPINPQAEKSLMLNLRTWLTLIGAL